MLDLLLTGLAAALWYIHPALGPWPLLLLAAGRLMRAVRVRGWRAGRGAPTLTPFDLPLLLFLLSAAFGAAIAYDAAAGAQKFWLILGGVALYDSVALAPAQVRLGRWRLAPLALLFGVLPSFLALYFLLTNDWGQSMGKLPALDPAMRWVASWRLNLPGHRLHPNVAGGLLAALLPIQLTAWSGAGRRAARRFLGAGFIAITVAALVLSASRGAWAAVLVAAVLALAVYIAALWQRSRGANRPVAGPGYNLPAVGVFCGLFVLAGVAAVTIAPLSGRLSLLGNSLDLALDYPFTGLGLNGFEMAYSSYVLLLHVGHTVHSHNLFVNVWLEQGLMGLAALAWLLGLSLKIGVRAWRQAAGLDQTASTSYEDAAAARRDLALHVVPPLAALAGLAGLGVIVIHGQVDDAFYGSRAVLWLFLPFALLARQHLAAAIAPARTAPEPAARRSSRWLAPIVVLLLLALLPPVRAAFQENLGAVAQTRAELSVYRWPDWPIQDALRRSRAIDLTPAITRYQAALALNPGNAAANRRLGQIEISLGQYQAAGQHLAAAYRSAPAQRATRQLLGEYDAVTGDLQSAAALWRTVDMSEDQAAIRQFWYQYIHEPARAAYLQQAAALAGR